MSTMAELSELAEQSIPVGDLLDAVLSRTGYLDALEAEALGGAEKTIEAQGRLENLDQLVEVAQESWTPPRARRTTRSTCSCSSWRSSQMRTPAARTRVW